MIPFSLLGELFGFTKLPQWAKELLVIALLLVTFWIWLKVHDHDVRSAAIAHENAALEAQSRKLNDANDAKIAKLTQDLAAEVAANRETRDAALRAANAMSGALDERVRAFDAYRRAAQASVGSSTGGSTAAGGGECGAVSCGDLAVRALQDGDDLAGHVAKLVVLLQSGQRERDSLTGLPGLNPK